MSLGAEIRARMSLDSSGVKAGVDKAKGHVGGFNTSLKGIAGTLGIAFGAGAAVKGILDFSKAAVDLAVSTKEAADQTGLAVEQYQAFYAAAMMVTGGAESAKTGLVNFRAAQQEALDGNKTSIEAFKKLGVSLEDIANKSTPQLLEAVAKGYKAVGDFGALVDIFGKKNAGKLEEALIALADDGFGGLEKSARNAGMMVGDEFSARLDDASDSIDRFKLKAKVMWLELMAGAIQWGQEWGAFFRAMWDGVKVTAKELWDPSVSLSPRKVMDAFGAGEAEEERKYKIYRDRLTYDDKLFRQKRAQDREEDEKKESELRSGKIKKIYADEAAEAAKVEDKKAEAAAKAEEKKKADQLKTLDELTQAAADSAGVSVTEIKGAGAAQFQQRFDSLRQIGANVLGSGVIRPAGVDREAEIATATRQTAENTARLVQKLDSQPVSRLAASTAVY